MNVVFLKPIFLTLLLLAVTPWLVPGRRRRGGWHPFLRAAVLTLLSFALARPTMLKNVDRGVHVVIQDGVASQPWLDELNQQSNPVRVIDVTEAQSLGQALATAALEIPEAGRGSITLVSDGQSIRQDWGNVVHQLTERGLPIHTVDQGLSAGDVFPYSISTEAPLKLGETARVQVRVAGGRGDDVELSNAETGEVLASGKGWLEFEPEAAGFLKLKAHVKVEIDADRSNNVLTTTLAVQDPWRLLYLGNRTQGGGKTLQTLLGASVKLERVDTSRDSMEVLETADVIVLDDAPAASVPEDWQKAMASQVAQHGKGLMMSGGNSAFGPGGYHDTLLAKILPTEFVQKEEKRDPSTTLAIIIDTSGSMSGERVQLAKEVARLAVRRLLPHDKVGIVEFYGTKQWAAPIQSAANAIDIQRALNRLDAGGGTVILPAIEEAYYAMQNVQTRYKHVLILTDGGVEAGAFEPLLRKMAGKGMNVSTVLVGGDTHSEFLVNIANWGKGHFYSASNRFSIPEILLKQPSTSKIPSYRPGEHTVRGRGGRGWWDDVDPTTVPILHGYVETRPRKGAEVLLETEAMRHPIITTWRYGLGRVTAMTTEPTGQGTGPWQAWEGYGPWLARVVAKTAREQRQVFDFQVTRRGAEVQVRATRLVDTQVLPQLQRLLDDGSLAAITMERRAPRVFTAALNVDPEIEVRLLGTTQQGVGAPQRLVSPARADVSAPNQVDPSQRLDLKQLASLTNGDALGVSELSGWQPTLGGGETSLSVRKLWLWCLALALLLYLTDILYRRLPARDSR